MSNIVTLQLSDMNKDDTQRMANLKYDGGDLLGEQTKLWVNKFQLTTQSYPLHIPNLSTTWSPFIPPGATNTFIPDLSAVDYYYTDWVVSIKTSSGYSATAPVMWEKTGFKQPLPININNDYFWVKTGSYICDIVTSAFNKINLGSFYFLKSGPSWYMAASKDYMTTNGTVTVYFNDAMRKFFNFNYNDDGGFLIKSINMKSIDGNSFAMVQTESTNNFLFPFDRLILTSSGLPVPPLFFQNNGALTFNESKNVILSYDLNISDINELGNTISFNTISSDRSLTLTGYGGVTLIPFNIMAYFVMLDGTEFQVRLKKGDKLSLEMNFY